MTTSPKPKEAFHSEFVHKLPVRVYYEDTDAGGVVYYANYLHFAERGRTEYLRYLNLDHQQLMRDFGMLFVVKLLNAEYHASAKLDDLITVETKVTVIGGASLDMNQSLRHEDGRKLVTASTKLVAITSEGRVLRIPDPIRTAFVTGQPFAR
jgi:acyl-CoA thioester hydrolase